jgi:hypothetical protein
MGLARVKVQIISTGEFCDPETDFVPTSVKDGHLERREIWCVTQARCSIHEHSLWLWR